MPQHSPAALPNAELLPSGDQTIPSKISAKMHSKRGCRHTAHQHVFVGCKFALVSVTREQSPLCGASAVLNRHPCIFLGTSEVQESYQQPKLTVDFTCIAKLSRTMPVPHQVSQTLRGRCCQRKLGKVKSISCSLQMRRPGISQSLPLDGAIWPLHLPIEPLREGHQQIARHLNGC